MLPFPQMYGFRPQPLPFPSMMGHPPPSYGYEQPQQEEEETHSEQEEVEEAVEEKGRKEQQTYIVVSGDVSRIDVEDETGVEEKVEEDMPEEEVPEEKSEEKVQVKQTSSAPTVAVKVPKSTSDPEYKKLIDNLETLRTRAPPYVATRPKPLIVVRGNGEIIFSPSQNRLKTVAGFSEGQVKQISTNLRKPYEVHKIDLYGTDSVETIQVISLPVGTKR